MHTLKNFNYKMKVKKYYAEEMNKGKSYIGSIIDKVIIRCIIFIALIIYTYIKTNSIIISSIISIQFITIYIIVLQKLNKKKMNQCIEFIDKQLVKEKTYKNLIDKTPYEYIEYIEKLLKGFGINNTQNFNEKGMDIIGELKEEHIGVKCYQYKEDHKVDTNDVKEFFLELRDKNIKKGMIVTTSCFTEDVKTFFKRLEGYVEVMFIDMDELISTMKRTELYPTKSEIEKMILQKITDNRIKIKNESKKIVSRDSTKKCIVSGIMLILFGKITPYTMYYNIVGYILIFLGIVPVMKSLIELIISKNTEKSDEKSNTM